ncbi:hypothetical protein CEE45_14925 [Candidatus Heimdallarchaeota archaeon B3_Heim]|nr:MAG: hypothetical protein CEE45_14925 [Candidatus Heimdallarchaeota archaeon B3_Heim]
MDGSNKHNGNRLMQQNIRLVLVAVCVNIIVLMISFSIDGASLSFQTSLTIQGETDYSIDECPRLDELVIIANETNTESISLEISGWFPGHVRKEYYNLTPGSRITSKTETILPNNWNFPHLV